MAPTNICHLIDHRMDLLALKKSHFSQLTNAMEWLQTKGFHARPFVCDRLQQIKQYVYFFDGPRESSCVTPPSTILSFSASTYEHSLKIQANDTWIRALWSHLKAFAKKAYDDPSVLPVSSELSFDTFWSNCVKPFTTNRSHTFKFSKRRPLGYLDNDLKDITGCVQIRSGGTVQIVIRAYMYEIQPVDELGALEYGFSLAAGRYVKVHHTGNEPIVIRSPWDMSTLSAFKMHVRTPALPFQVQESHLVFDVDHNPNFSKAMQRWFADQGWTWSPRWTVYSAKSPPISSNCACATVEAIKNSSAAVSFRAVAVYFFRAKKRAHDSMGSSSGRLSKKSCTQNETCGSTEV